MRRIFPRLTIWGYREKKQNARQIVFRFLTVLLFISTDEIIKIGRQLSSTTRLYGQSVQWYLAVNANHKTDKQTSVSTMKSYPNIAQSFGISGILILGFILFSPVSFTLRKLIGSEASFLIYYLLAAGTTFWIICKIKKKKTGYISFNISIENRRVIPFIIIGAIFLYCGIVSPMTALVPMSETHKEAFLNRGFQVGLFSILQSIIASPILEELIFTGIILDGLLKKYSPIKSILIYSLIFGLTHLSPTQFIVGFIMSLFSGWVYYKTKILTFSILIHFVYNLSSVLLKYFINYDSMKDSILLGMFGGLANLIYVVIGSAIIILICIYFLEKEFNKKKIEMATYNTML